MRGAETRAMRLQRVWWGGEPVPWRLRTLSGVFAAGVRLRRAAYESGWLVRSRVGRPVIVVGNITVGGSGKTPLVVWLCEQLRSLGAQPGVVLRGYGASAAHAAAPQRVSPDAEVARVGDEALLLAQRTAVPVAVGRDRVAAARLLLAAGVQVIVADDGLQHLRLARDLELAVVDAARGLGNGRLLPAGPLREPAARLATVDAVVLNGADSGLAGLQLPASMPRLHMQLQGERLVPLQADAQPMPLAQLAGRRVRAIAGIGNPERFFSQLRAAGLEVVAQPFADHHAYRAGELRFTDRLPLLMTEKDAVKCRAFGLIDAWYLPVAASFPPDETRALRERLRALLGRPAQGMR
jgi:tetraacyldisaccharide 4'-kinase